MTKRTVRAYTLLEMLVAMTIFAIVSVGAGIALTTGVHDELKATRHSDDLVEARTVLSRVCDDLRWAIGSTDNLTTLFVATGDTDGDLLTLTTLTHRIQGSGVDNGFASGTPGVTGSSGVTDVSDQPWTPPQSRVAYVTYNFSSQTHELTRSEVPTPPSQIVGDPTPTPVLLSNRVSSITIEFTDSTGETRTDWDYEAQAVASSVATTTAGGGSSVTSDQTDTTLPVTAKVTVDVLGANDQTLEMSRSVVFAMPTPLPIGQGAQVPGMTGSLPAGLPQARPAAYRRLAQAPGLGVRADEAIR